MDQVALFQWSGMMWGRYPALEWMYAVPNGGHRHKGVAAKLKAEGVRAGVPDICLPAPMRPWHGLYIEMKSHTGAVSAQQKRWGAGLRAQGYWVSVCWSWDDARETIEGYLNGEFGEELKVPGDKEIPRQDWC